MTNIHLVEKVRRRFWAERSDGELLAAFVARREPEAFRELTERYALLVWSVCRRQCSDRHLTEDAVQATFLALIRQASRVCADALAAWLVCVARRICRKTRLAEFRRRRREAGTATRDVTSTSIDELSMRELMAVLDEEVENLGQRERAALLACYWQGLPQADAARRLGTTPAAVKGLLERGRAKLLTRLQRRGLTSDVALRGLLVAPLALAAVPGNLFAGIAAMVDGSVSPRIAALVPIGGLIRRGTYALVSLALGVGLIFVSGAMPQKPAADRPPAVQPKPAPLVDRLGDPLPEGALLRLGTTRFRHPNNAETLVLSPDGKIVVTQGSDKLIAWDAATGKEIWRESELAKYNAGGSYAGTHTLAFSPNGKQLVTPAAHSSIAVWEVASGRHRLIDLKGTATPGPGNPGERSNIRAIDIAPNGRSLAIGAVDGVYLCDFDGNVRKRIPNAGGIQNLQNKGDRLQFRGDYSLAQYSPDGKTLAVVTSDTPKILRLCDPATGDERRRIELEGYLVRMAFSLDGKRVAVTERDNAVRVYDTATGKRLHSWVVKLNNPYENYTSAVAFSPDGKLVAAGATDHVIYLWDATTGKEAGQLKGTGWYPWGLAFSPDSKTLYSTGWDGTVRRWDVTTRKQLPLPDGGVRGSEMVAAARDGRVLAYVDDADTVRLVDAKTGKEIKQMATINGGVSRLAFSPDSRFLAAGGSHDDKLHVILWDLATATVKRRWDWEKGRDPHSSVEDIVFSPDGKQIAAAVFRRSEVRVFSVIGQQEQTLKHNSVYGLDFGPDGTLATAGWDKAIRLWNPTTGELQKQFLLDSPQFQDSRMYAVRISPDGRLLAAALMDGHVFVADAKTLAMKNSFRMDASFIFPALAFSPDGLRVATGDTRGRVRVWDPLSGAKLWDRGEHGGYVYDVRFGRDSRTLLAGGNGLGYLWDLRPSDLPTKEMASLWADLIGTDAVAADRAFWALLEQPDETVKWFAKSIRPVRAEPVDAGRVNRLVAELDDAKFAKREAAQAELAKLGLGAAPSFKKALAASGSAEARRRLSQLLDRLENDDATVLRYRRVVGVLQHLGTPAAIELLRTWAGAATDSLAGLAETALKNADR